MKKREAQLKLDAASVEALKLENELLKGEMSKQQKQLLRASIQKEAQPLKQVEEKVSSSNLSFIFGIKILSVFRLRSPKAESG